MCTFGGREFDCCTHAEPLMTDMGKCYRFAIRDAVNDSWMQTQKQAGVSHG
jgi:hypothetical protein